MFSVPVFFSIAYLIVEVTNAFEWKYGIWIVIGFWIGTIIKIIFDGIKPKYIYDLSIKRETLEIKLVNVLGTQDKITLSVDQIEKIKYQKSNSWRFLEKIWIHLDNSILELFLIRKELEEALSEFANIEKVKD